MRLAQMGGRNRADVLSVMIALKLRSNKSTCTSDRNARAHEIAFGSMVLQGLCVKIAALQELTDRTKISRVAMHLGSTSGGHDVVLLEPYGKFIVFSRAAWLGCAAAYSFFAWPRSASRVRGRLFLLMMSTIQPRP